MSLRLSTDQLKVIKAHAESTYPEECCGLLLGSSEAMGKVVVDIRATENVWDTETANVAGDLPLAKSHRYWIAPTEMLAGMKEARSRNLDIIGIYHSHPDHPAIPSECDRQLAWSQYSYLIVSVERGRAIDQQSWILDDHHQFQPEAIQLEEPARM